MIAWIFQFSYQYKLIKSKSSKFLHSEISILDLHYVIQLSLFYQFFSQKSNRLSAGVYNIYACAFSASWRLTVSICRHIRRSSTVWVTGQVDPCSLKADRMIQKKMCVWIKPSGHHSREGRRNLNFAAACYRQATVVQSLPRSIKFCGLQFLNM